MLNRPFSTVLTRLAIVAAILATLVLIAPVASAAAVKYSVPENTVDPVKRFTASDVEDDTITWGLEGEDKKDFEISDAGVLSFKEKPNFESPADEDKDNVYMVTVTATGESKATQDVEVTVTDVDEAGKVTINKPQPQVSRGLSAEVTDPDGDPTDVTWQWSRGPNVDGPWAAIDKATSNSHNPGALDVDHYLQVTATYTDEHGSGKVVSAVSEFPVEEKTVANARPKFVDDEPDTADTIEVNRSVNENAKDANVGKPVMATDADNDVLLYEIEASGTKNDGKGNSTANVTDIKDVFSIDPRTGQLKTKIKLESDDDGNTGDDDDHTPKEATYTVTVTAVDPSGAKASQGVTITVTDVNDVPEFNEDNADKEIWVTERDATKQLRTAEASGNLPDTAYVVTDDDADDSSFTYALEGADKAKFNISAAGKLTVATDHAPDYEKQSSYSITVTGADDEKAKATVDVTVKVVNANDPGTVKLSQREPQVDQPVIASLTDQDGSITSLSWQWYWDNDSTASDATFPTTGTCSSSSDNLCIIDGATSPTYTPTEVKPGGSSNTNTPARWFLTARATYSDKVGSDRAHETPERGVQPSDPANTAPKFADDNDPNTPGNQADVERSVAENAKGANVGDAITANDTDLLMYTLSGTHAASFEVGRDDGQITTAEKLNHEVKSSYMVVLIAKDPSGAMDTTNVNITVTDADDKGVITGDKAFDYAENGSDAVGTFTATDEDGEDIVWSLDGADKAKFEISDAGVLSFKDSPNFEATGDKADADTDNVYMVTVTANGGEHKVEITVTDVDEPGKVKLNQPQPQVGRTIMASGEDSDPDKPISEIKWQWSSGASKDGPFTDIDKKTSASLTPETDQEGMYLRATLTYTDKHGKGKTVSAVSENTVEEKTLANAKPSFKDQDETGPTEDDDGNTGGIQDNIVVTRAVDENKDKGALVGKPVTATDADGDILLYTLTDADATDQYDPTDDFSIDPRTGQIKTKEKLDSHDGDFGQDGTSRTAVVTVTATDPSGASEDQDVTITVNDVNDAPMFLDYITTTATVRDAPPKTLYVTEVEGTTNTEKGLHTDDEVSTDLRDNTYVVQDDDLSDAPNPDVTPPIAFTYTLEGADKDKFHISDEGVLTVCTENSDSCGTGKNHDPDYETQKSYSITIKGADNDGAAASIDVTVKVLNAEDAGKVGLNRRAPMVGLPIVASLDDPDGGEKDLKWQWYFDNDYSVSNSDLDGAGDCSATSSSLCKIVGATSPSYTPTATKPGGSANVNDPAEWYLVVRVEYTDAYVTETGNPPVDAGDKAFRQPEADVRTENAANSAPKFPEDTDGNTAGKQTTYEFTVAENEKKGTVVKNSLHSAVAATDADGDTMLLYSLSGTDAASFTIVSGIDGPADIGTIKTAEVFDYEKKSSYTVVATATDRQGASGSITVNITVTDVDDKPTLRPNDAPVFANDTETRSVDEDRQAGAVVGAPVTATDADDADKDNLTYALSGDDAAMFDIDNDGQITVGADTMLDHETTDSYSVTVTATDTGDLSDSVDVTITVNDLNEKPTFATDTATALSVDENSPAGTAIGGAFMATDVDDGDTKAYSLSGDDAASFAIDDMGQITNTADLNHEEKDSYSVTVTVTDSGDLTDSVDVTITVNDVNEKPMFADDTATALSVDENSDPGTAIGGAFMATDVDDGDTKAYSLSGDDAASFAIDDMGQITNTAMLDHEEKDSYSVTVTVTDSGDLTDSVDVTIAVNDVNEAPMFADDTATALSVDENSEVGTAIGDAFMASDEDADDTTAYSLDDGDDAASFAIDSATGQISVAEGADLNYEEKASYSVTVTATDSDGLTDTIAVTIAINDVPETPVFDEETANRSVEENSAGGTNVGDPVTAVHAESYSDDSDSFDVDAMGQITVAAGTMLDYETMKTYTVTITATGVEGDADTITVTVTVTNSQVGCDDAGSTDLINDCEALLDSKPVLDGSLNWTDHTHTTMPEWTGVTMTDGRVTGLDLRDSNLNGTVPAALGRLSALTYLNLRSNELTGSIPADLGNLSNLTYLSLLNNSLSGDIPDLSGMSSLEQLYLNKNELTGGVPTTMPASVTTVWLWDNNLSGSVPDLSGLANLTELKLAANELTGGVPMASTLPPNIKMLTLHANPNLGGTIPDLSSLTNLKTLWIHSAGLTGEVPATLPTSLSVLNLKDNSLTSLGNLSELDNLRKLYLHRNKLSGSIPGSLGGLERVTHIYLHGNDLTGIDGGFAGVADTLTHLYLDGNQWADDACLPGDLASVENNDFEDAGLAACAQ